MNALIRDRLADIRVKIHNHEDVADLFDPLEVVLFDSNKFEYGVQLKHTKDMIHVSISDIVFKKKEDQKGFNQLKRHFKFLGKALSFMRRIQEEMSFEADLLKQLFHSFVVESSDSVEMFAALHLFYQMHPVIQNADETSLFYKNYFKPLMTEYGVAKNYPMLVRLYLCFRCYIFKSLWNPQETMEEVRKESAQLKLDTIDIFKCILDEFNDDKLPKNRLKVWHLLTTLTLLEFSNVTNPNFITLTNKLTNLLMDSQDSISLSGPLSAKFKSVLREIFLTFASNGDGTMGPMDLKRYILAMGAGSLNVSELRIQSVFSIHEGHHAKHLSLNGFWNFYRAASFDRPQFVWNDLRVFGYNTDLKLQCPATKDDISMHGIISKALDVFDSHIRRERDQINGADQFAVLLRLPRGKIIEQELYKLDKPIHELLECEKSKLYSICYKLTILYAICHRDDDDDNEWRQRFLEKRGFEHLLKILFRADWLYMYKNALADAQANQLGFALLLRIMHYCCSSPIPMHDFIKKAAETECSLIIPDDVEHIWIYMICCETSTEFVNIIPQSVSDLYTKPLVLGYIAGCKIYTSVPNEIVSLLCWFLHS